MRQHDGSFRATLDQILAVWPNDPQKRGQTFERLIVEFLKNDPAYGPQFKAVRLWRDFAKTPDAKALGIKDGRDTGIDIVATDHDGMHTAVQCKCHQETTRLRADDLASFIVEATKKAPDRTERFPERIIVDTGAQWSRNLEKDAVEHRVRRIDFAALDNAGWKWPDIVRNPDKLPEHTRRPHRLRPHQKTALDSIEKGFATSDRGRLIMACGTGKTLVALHAAERIAGPGRTVLYLVPSISLLSQTMREFANHRNIPHRYIGVCSDTTAGKTADDDPDRNVSDLAIPVTTDRDEIVETLAKSIRGTTVVFSTYQSLPVIAKAMNEASIPDFDLVLCDEAHRTAGFDTGEREISAFRIIHDNTKIRARKRLYMTATPRIYGKTAKLWNRVQAKYPKHDLASMDDESIYGPEFHHYTFGKAVGEGILTDYRVVIFVDKDSNHTKTANAYAYAHGKATLNEATLMAAGAAALDNPEDAPPDDPDRPRARRVIAFTNSIRRSKALQKHWPGIVEQHVKSLDPREQATRNRIETRHVDGTMSARDRANELRWLAEDAPRTIKIVSNARCLSEGVDVPALDGIIFTKPKESQIDIIQAVGRVMRRIPGKECGYIVVPVTVPEGSMQGNLLPPEEYSKIFRVVRALRSHDERMTHEIHQKDMPRILIMGPGVKEGDDIGTRVQEEQEQDITRQPVNVENIRQAIYERCGDRAYWSHWAGKLKVAYDGVHQRAKALHGNDPDVRKAITTVAKRIHQATGIQPTEAQTISMVAQHRIIIPVFDALFQNDKFTQENPIAASLRRTVDILDKKGLDEETRRLEDVFESIRSQAEVKDRKQRQEVFIEMFQNFIKNVFKEECKENGVEYTPVEIVDFILHSVDELLDRHFNKRLTSEDVHILDPYAGTGSFIVRMIESGLIRKEDLERKFLHELHANEIMLLPYYIACANIEQAYQAQGGDGKAFPGMLWTDTLGGGDNAIQDLFDDPMQENKERRKKQDKLPIRAIMGNPPFNVGKNKEKEDNTKKYKNITGKIQDTYARKSTATNKQSLYDLQIMAIRHASDRIKEQGIIAFVTNNGWLDGAATSGVRAVLREEFDEIHVVNLKGRLHSKDREDEGGSVFGITVGIALAFLVRLPGEEQKEGTIYYHDIGSNLKAKEKLGKLLHAKSIKGLGPSTKLEPDSRHNWLGNVSDEWWNLIPLAKEKKGSHEKIIFEINTKGQSMSPNDNLAQNFKKRKALRRGKDMIEAYKAKPPPIKEIPKKKSELGWSRELVRMKNSGKQPRAKQNAEKILYRPFLNLWCYQEEILVSRRHQTHKAWPTEKTKNTAIGVTTKSATHISLFATEKKPDYLTLMNSTWFPRHTYTETTTPSLGLHENRKDNITDWALRVLQDHYKDESITKDDIFHYVYGVLHALDFRKKYEFALLNEKPRIPLASDFHAFAEAGKQLLDLHTAEEVPNPVRLKVSNPKAPDKDFNLDRKMKLSYEKGTLEINDKITLSGIPPHIQEWQIGGHDALWYLVNYLDPDRPQYFTDEEKTDRINDPNDHFGNPKEVVGKVEKVVTVAERTMDIIQKLPPALPGSKRSGTS